MGFDITSFLMGKAAGGGGGGGGSTVDKTHQNYAFTSGVHCRAALIGDFTSYTCYWLPLDSSGNALRVNWSKAFHLHIKFKFSQADNRSEALFGAYGNGLYWHGTLSMEAQTDKWFFPFSTSGSAWTNETYIPFTEFPFNVNVFYTVDIVYDGGTTITITMNDGTNSASRTITLSATLYNSNYDWGFGNIGLNTSLYARYCAFDPDDCYIESEGEIVWGAKTLA